MCSTGKTSATSAKCIQVKTNSECVLLQCSNKFVDLFLLYVQFWFGQKKTHTESILSEKGVNRMGWMEMRDWKLLANE